MPPMKFGSWLGVVAVPVFASTLPSVAQAADIEVACTTQALVDAVDLANTTAGEDTLHLSAGCVYTFAAPTPSHFIPLLDENRYPNAAVGFWMGPTALPMIYGRMNIDGRGATIERSSAAGTPAFRFLSIVGSVRVDGVFNRDNQTVRFPVPSTMRIQNVTFRNGLALGGSGHTGGAGLGGAILAQGSVTLTGVTFVNNEARGGQSNPASSGGGGGLGGNAPGRGGGGFFGNGADGGGGAGGNAIDICPGASSANGILTSEGNCTAEFQNLPDPWGTGGAPDIGGGGRIDAPGTFGAGGGARGAGGYGGGGGELAAGGWGGGGGVGANGGFGGGGGGGVPTRIGMGGFGAGAGGAVGLSLPVGQSAAGGGGGGGGFGGALFAHGATITIVNSTFTHNTAQGGAGSAGRGGGVSSGFTIFPSGGGGGGSGYGGAIFSLDTDMTIRSTTIADNFVIAGAGGAAGPTIAGQVALAGAAGNAAGTALYGLLRGSNTEGGALYTPPALPRVIIQNSILASGGALSDCVLNTTTLTSNGHNVVRNAGTCAFTGSGDRVAIDPRLGALADNGGPTFTMAPLGGSPVIGTGSCSETLDQRGATRISVPTCDVGAYEVGGVFGGVDGGVATGDAGLVDAGVVDAGTGAGDAGTASGDAGGELDAGAGSDAGSLVGDAGDQGDAGASGDAGDQSDASSSGDGGSSVSDGAVGDGSAGDGSTSGDGATRDGAAGGDAGRGSFGGAAGGALCAAQPGRSSGGHAVWFMVGLAAMVRRLRRRA